MDHQIIKMKTIYKKLYTRLKKNKNNKRHVKGKAEEENIKDRRLRKHFDQG